MEKKLLLQELADLLAVREGITKKKADVFTKSFFEVVEQGLETDKFVKIKGFGTFKVISVSDRESVNVNTGERIQITGHSKITFTPDAELRDLINRPFAHFETVILNDSTDLAELEAVNFVDEAESQVSLQEAESADENEVASSASTATLLTDVPKPETVAPEHEEETVKPVPFPANFPDNLPNLPADMVTAEDAGTPAASEFPLEPEAVTGSRQPEPIPVEADTSETSESGSGISHENPGRDEACQTGASTDARIVAEEGEGSGTPALADARHAEEDCTPAAATPRVETVSEDGNIPASEQEEGHGPAIGAQAPVLVPMKPAHASDKFNWWKAIAVFAVVFLLMVLSYFAGYFRLFCPCEFIEEWQARTAWIKDSKHGAQSPVVEADTVLPAVVDTFDMALPDSTTVAPVEERGVEQVAKVSQPAQPATPQKSSPVQVDSTRIKQKAKPAGKPNTRREYSQVPGGKYRITGTRQRYTVSSGETVRSIAEYVYGSKGYAPYIITHNHLRNPNNIAVGSVLLLPELEKVE